MPTKLVCRGLNWGVIVGILQVTIPIVCLVIIAVFGLWVKGIDLKYEIRTKIVLEEGLKEYDKNLPATYFSYTEGRLLQQEVKTVSTQVKVLGDRIEGMNNLQKEMLQILRGIANKQR